MTMTLGATSSAAAAALAGEDVRLRPSSASCGCCAAPASCPRGTRRCWPATPRHAPSAPALASSPSAAFASATTHDLATWAAGIEVGDDDADGDVLDELGWARGELAQAGLL